VHAGLALGMLAPARKDVCMSVCVVCVSVCVCVCACICACVVLE